MQAGIPRWSSWMIPFAGVLTLGCWVGLALAGAPQTNPRSNPAGFAQFATGTPHIILGNLYIVGLLCLILGVLALYARVANTPGGIWMLTGTALGIVALTLVTGVWIVLTYVDAVIGDAYRGGNSGAGELFRWMAGGQWSARFFPLFVVVGVAGLLGAICLGTGIWRSGRFPPWVAVSFGLAFVLAVVSAPLITMIGALLLMVSGTVMARGA